jgi:hypothetical protein
MKTKRTPLDKTKAKLIERGGGGGEEEEEEGGEEGDDDDDDVNFL